MRLLNLNRIIVLSVLRVTMGNAASKDWRRVARDPKFAFQEMSSLLFIGGVVLAGLFPWPWFWLLQMNGEGPLLAAAKYWVVLLPVSLTATGTVECCLRSGREKDELLEAKVADRVDVFGNVRVLLIGSLAGYVVTVVSGLLLGWLAPF